MVLSIYPSVRLNNVHRHILAWVNTDPEGVSQLSKVTCSGAGISLHLEGVSQF